MGALYGRNLYIGLEKTLHEYAVEENFAVDALKPKARLDPGRYDDAWYFACVLSNEDYVLNMDTDKVLHRNRVWLNYKVSRNGVPLGAISSGLDFSQAAAKLFSDYDDNRRLRLLIIDGGGTVHMDSGLPGQDAFLAPDSEVMVEDISSDPGFLAAIRTHLVGIQGYFDSRAKPRAIELPTGPYSYASIAPIISTNWSVVAFFESSYLFDQTKLLPFFVIITVLFILFVLVTNMFSRELIFVPFEQLIRSLVRVKENDKERIYGTDRDDEFGILSNTIQDLFIKANRDALTGLYNRRFLEKNLQRSIESISRYGGVLSVLMIDVDFFKKYNDRYGHGVGDDCLRSIAEALEGGIMRADDFVARYGGEEFVAVLPNADEHGARLVAERLLKKVRDLKILHEENDSGSGWATVSIGITSSKAAHTQNGQDYLKRADEAMYMSKQKGRNQCFFLPFQEGSVD
jgi:diguanylate cyclase (GGDEF)-like protein